jgi:hypothetical protein
LFREKRQLEPKKEVVLLSQSGIRDAVLCGDMTWQQALDLITSPKEVPWHTSEWKKQRDALIGSVCTQCGSVEPPMVLQHLWQPTKVSDLFEQRKAFYHRQYDSQYPLISIEDIPEEQWDGLADGCPRCHSTVINCRKKSVPAYICQAQKNKRKCHFEFDEPVQVRVMSQQQKDSLRQQRKESYREWCQQFDALYKDCIGKEVVLISIDEHERYMSFADVTTFCKKCAFLWDMKGIALCPVCKEMKMKVGLRRLGMCFGCHVEERHNSTEK